MTLPSEPELKSGPLENLRERKIGLEKVFSKALDPHMCEVKLLGRGVQILFSGRGMVKICSGRGRNCFI